MSATHTAGGPDFIAAVPDELAALAYAVARVRPDLLPLDLSYASLDRLEDFYRACLAEPSGAGEVTEPRLAAYVGATLAEHAGGRWEPPRAKTDFGRPSITKLPHLGRAKFYPLDVVRNFRRLRAAGYLRDATERYDIPLRRAQLAQAVADSGSRLAALRADVRDLTGRDPGALDGRPEQLAAVEEALRRLVADGAPRELSRRAVSGAVLYLGELARRAFGGEWSVCEDPAGGDLGQWQVDGWAPLAVVWNVGPNSRPNLLQSELDLVIASRSKR